MPEISFRVYGIPKGQPRPRAFVRHTHAGPVARVFDSGSAEAFKSDIAIAARGHVPSMPIAAAITVDAVFLFPRPKRLMRRSDPIGRIPHLTKPDADNVWKAFVDAGTHLGLWVDDSVLSDVRVRKLYVGIGEAPGAQIQISWDETAEPQYSTTAKPRERAAEQEKMF